MKEVTFNTAISFTKKQIVMNGLGECIDASLHALMRHSADNFADMIIEDLKDEDNQYQFILTIKKME